MHLSCWSQFQITGHCCSVIDPLGHLFHFGHRGIIEFVIMVPSTEPSLTHTIHRHTFPLKGSSPVFTHILTPGLPSFDHPLICPTPLFVLLSFFFCFVLFVVLGFFSNLHRSRKWSWRTLVQAETNLALNCIQKCRQPKSRLHTKTSSTRHK